MTLGLRFAALSHVGLLRDGNEDSVYAGPRVLAVADGMGGHAAGEVASAVAIASIASLDDDDPGPDLLDALRACAVSANDHLRDMVTGDAGLDGMGTTLTAMLFAGTRLGVVHIGDSRCYLLRDDELTQITHDHTLVQTLVDDGRISEEEASSHPQRSLITRALDGRESIELDLSVREARPGDRYLLCTDGLTGPVGRKETLQEALGIADPEQACERLVQLALRGGGPDNVTVVVADVVDAGSASGQPVVGGAAAASPQHLPDGLSDGAAARARAAERPAAPDTAEPETRPVEPAAAAPRRRRTGLLLLLPLLVLLLAGAAAAGGYAYLQNQYYVGVDGETVAVYRGVNGTVAGVPLASVEERTDLPVERLGVVARSRVERGIVAEDRQDADEIVRRLEANALPECPEPAEPAEPADPAAPADGGVATAPEPAPVETGTEPGAPDVLTAECAPEAGS
ncbi:MAG TPA: protein phosphatase 2C domain-containing protein [Mycobacteriales bacterium]|nr:protein phosphatase 2C domain-containing protein [Mycobacteriales bacterium]